MPKSTSMNRWSRIASHMHIETLSSMTRSGHSDETLVEITKQDTMISATKSSSKSAPPCISTDTSMSS